MAKLDKNKWLSTDTYDFVEKDGKLYAVHSTCDKKESTLIRNSKELYEYTKKVAKKAGVDLEKLCEGLYARIK